MSWFGSEPAGAGGLPGAGVGGPPGADGVAGASLNAGAARSGPDGPLRLATVASTWGMDTAVLTPFVEQLSGTVDTITVDELMGVQVDDIKAAIGEAHIEGVVLHALQKSALIRFLRHVATVAGVEPPDFGTFGASRPSRFSTLAL